MNTQETEPDTTAPEGSESAESSAAKNLVYDALAKELDSQGIDPYSEKRDQLSPDLIDLADTVVECLLREGATLPDGLRDPHRP